LTAPTETEDEKNFIRMANNAWEDHYMFDYGMFLRSGDNYIGNIGIHTINWENSRAEIGYWVFSDFEGNGYVSEALCFIEKILFGTGFNRIEIRCDSNNVRSSQVPQRNNYTLEGILRENAFYKNQYINTMVFSKLKDEYFKDRTPEISDISSRFYSRRPFIEELYFIHIMRKNRSLFTFINMENKAVKFDSIKKWFKEKPQNIDYRMIFRKDTKEPVGGYEIETDSSHNIGIEILTCYKNLIKELNII
jgi:RimJ/RimL family protein N-acetyltransferase